METPSQLYDRQDKEMKELMRVQLITWQALNEQYGRGNIPENAYQQWDQRYGNVRLHALQAQHEAEIEFYPASPYEHLYQAAREQHPESTAVEGDVFDQLLAKEQVKEQEHESNEKLVPEMAVRQIDDDVFARLEQRYRQASEQKQDQELKKDVFEQLNESKEKGRNGYDPER